MASVSESISAPSQMESGLIEGLQTLSDSQVVTFTQYSRQILPADGWIFWLNTGAQFSFQGSLHISTRLEQREDETIGINQVTFTAINEIQDFNEVGPSLMYIATVPVGNEEIQFAFADQANFYEEAGLYHYSGDAVYPALAQQIINTAADLDLSDVIVSNSLPIWLSLVNAEVFGLTAPTFPIYPSFLIPQDAAPPYAGVHIGDDDTSAIQAAPSFDYENSHFQLCKDHVKITLYGLRNAEALAFQDFVFQYSLNTDNIGVMNIPIIKDEKRTQRELGILAQKKSFTIDVSYYQASVQAASRQLILDSIQTYLPNSL